LYHTFAEIIDVEGIHQGMDGVDLAVVGRFSDGSQL
jgi:hypothetical protein